MRFAFLLLPLLAILSHVYVLWHVYQVLPLPVWSRMAVVALMVLSLVMMFAGLFGLFDRMPLNLASLAYEVSTSWLIVFLYLLLIFIALDLGSLLHIVPGAWLRGNGWTAAAVTAIVTALLVGGSIHYRHKVRQPLNLDTDKRVGAPVRVVMVSDIHLGYHNRKAEWQRWVSMLNAERPDLILIAGDIIDGYIRPLDDEDMAADFHDLDAPVMACPGNHEYLTGIDRSIDFCRRAGITLLRDTALSVGDLVVVGRDDRSNRSRKSVEGLLAGVDSDKYIILLDHQPYELHDAERAGVDFQFSGHTHEGQVWPISLLVHAMYEKAFGEHRRGKTRYYISSGLGIWGGKYRIGTRSEYVVATIHGTSTRDTE